MTRIINFYNSSKKGNFAYRRMYLLHEHLFIFARMGDCIEAVCIIYQLWYLMVSLISRTMMTFQHPSSALWLSNMVTMIDLLLAAGNVGGRMSVQRYHTYDDRAYHDNYDDRNGHDDQSSCCGADAVSWFPVARMS